MDKAKILELALDCGLLDYYDLETPKRYFIPSHADELEVIAFARKIILEHITEEVSKDDKGE